MTPETPLPLLQRLRSWRKAYGRDLTSAKGRRRARLQYQWMDHAILRHKWTNFHCIAPNVYRSNHPTHKRLVAMKEMGIASIINLRGFGRTAAQIFEEESCAELGLNLVKTDMSARKAPPVESFTKLFELFRTTPKPYVLHCKSGADRAGIASALYLLSQEGADIKTAQKQLSFRYLHIRKSKTGIMDHILDLYAAHLNAQGPMGIEEWMANQYDPVAVTASFAKLSVSAR